MYLNYSNAFNAHFFYLIAIVLVLHKKEKTESIKCLAIKQKNVI